MDLPDIIATARLAEGNGDFVYAMELWDKAADVARSTNQPWRGYHEACRQCAIEVELDRIAGDD
jgi:hypothetical protein